jgi:hypothetical protein
MFEISRDCPFQDATCLEVDDIKVLFGCFQLFDVKKQDYLLADEIDEVMR